MEDTTMIKKEYMKPEMQTVGLKHKCQILAGSVDPNGINDELINEEVNEGFSPELGVIDVLDAFGK